MKYPRFAVNRIAIRTRCPGHTSTVSRGPVSTIPAAIARVRIAVFAIYFTLPAVALSALPVYQDEDGKPVFELSLKFKGKTIDVIFTPEGAIVLFEVSSNAAFNSNVSFGLVGDFDAVTMTDLVRQYFGSLVSSGPPTARRRRSVASGHTMRTGTR